MIKSRVIILILLFPIVFVGSQKTRSGLFLRRNGLIGTTIVLPEKISCVYNGEVYPMPDSLRGKAKLIIYIDSTECTTCRITHLWEYQELFDLAEERQSFTMMILIWNKDFDAISLERYLSDLQLEYPLYVDMGCRFLEDNPSLPNDNRLHSFLVDETGHPICVGDPGRTKKMMEVYRNMIANCIN